LAQIILLSCATNTACALPRNTAYLGAEVSDVASGKQVINVHQEPLVDDLVVSQQEDDGGVLAACLQDRWLASVEC
jgi:hypothetical protein